MIASYQNIYFANPEFFLLLLLLPLIGAWYYFKKPKKHVLLRMPSLEAVAEMRSWKSKLLLLLPILRTLSLILFVLALARPQLTLKEEEVTAEGIDIMIAMDVSTSMDATDFNPNRIEVSKEMASNFVSKRPYDRIGLAVFAGESFTQCPLTTDHRVVKNFLKSLRTGMLEDGTAIGMGLASAVNRLKESEAESKIVILLTDGVNNHGYIDPETAADIAKEFKIKVYTIGIGTTGMVNIPYKGNGRSNFQYRRMRAEIDEALLIDIAEKTGGQYFHAQNEAALEKVYNYIDQLEKTEIQVNTFKRYSEEFRMFLYWGMIFLGIEYLLRNTLLKSLP